MIESLKSILKPHTLQFTNFAKRLNMKVGQGSCLSGEFELKI